MISVQKDGVKFSVVTGSAKEARLRSVLVSILGQSYSDDGAGVHGERSFLYRPLDLDLLEGLDTTALNSLEKRRRSQFFAGTKASTQATALSVSVERGSYQRVARRMNGVGVYQLG
ncbi:MAG: hypothetical protein DMG56_11385 [Acidobacteria bacterium]|nr:MAG: hypothetical protein DMG56_11385 [Acidobacteriota bacterium]